MPPAPAAVVLVLLTPWSAFAVDRLTIVNQCLREPIWIAHLANVGVGPGEQNAKIEPGGTKVFTHEETDGLGGARYWPKMGCDANGDNCAIGGSGGPTEKCSEVTPDYSSCAPPIDTKFEATWGREGEPCNPADPGQMAGCDFVDISLVDGWTLPFKLEVVGGTCTGKEERVVDNIDCSRLSTEVCPKDDDLGHGSIDLTAHSPKTQQPAGCYGPCLKLIDNKWGNDFANGRKREDEDVVPYCCTTPPEDSEKCNAGPIVTTKYVNAVHTYCPGVYSFAYDDGMGLMRCTYGAYKVVFFCPEGGDGGAQRKYEAATAVSDEAAELGAQAKSASVVKGAGLALLAAAAVVAVAAGGRRSRQHQPAAAAQAEE